MARSEKLGKHPIPQLLLQQSFPAFIGILSISIYNVVDTIFVGQYVGPNGIGAMAVVMPITFFIGALGMSVGIGGASIISRALGSNNPQRAFAAFGNQIMMTITLAAVVVTVGAFYQAEVLNLFGAKGAIFAPSSDYFRAVLPGIPFLAWSMMSNNVIRSEGRAKTAMMTMIIPAIFNIVLDPIFIVWLDMGIYGAGLATAIAYFAAAVFALWYFLFGGSELQLKWKYIVFDPRIVWEITTIGIPTFARQGVISLLAIVLNNTLFVFGAEVAVSAYGIISRLMMFIISPIIGITQGFIPIAGFNYGARNYNRLREVIRLAIIAGTAVSFLIFLLIFAFTEPLIRIFTSDADLVALTKPAMRIFFLLTPLIAIQLIGPAYYQATNKPLPALFLTLTKQGFFLIPFVVLLPRFFNLAGVWYSFPLADFLSAAVILSVLIYSVRALPKGDKNTG